jgi:hypothetical protein
MRAAFETLDLGLRKAYIVGADAPGSPSTGAVAVVFWSGWALRHGLMAHWP